MRFRDLFDQESPGPHMIRKLTVSIATAILLFALVPRAEADSVTVPANIIIDIDPVIVHGEPDPTATVVFTPREIDFVTPTYDIGATLAVFQGISTAAFGNPNAQMLIWDDSMPLIGCSFVSFASPCQGGVSFGNSGVIGDGTLFLSPRFDYMTIDSLTITTPEPSSLFLLGSGLLGLVGLFHRKLSVCP
jgi:hypothetical protein